MNAHTNADSRIVNTVPSPKRQGTPVPAGPAAPQTQPRRLSVWDERARKMGFPPGAR